MKQFLIAVNEINSLKSKTLSETKKPAAKGNHSLKTYKKLYYENSISISTDYSYPETHWSLNKLNILFTLTAPYKSQKTIVVVDDDDDDDTQQCPPPCTQKYQVIFLNIIRNIYISFQ